MDGLYRPKASNDAGWLIARKVKISGAAKPAPPPAATHAHYRHGLGEAGAHAMRFTGLRGALRGPAWQLRCLSDPTRHELLVELVGLVDVEVAHLIVLGLAVRRRTQ